jgi:hypothetical protein
MPFRFPSHRINEIAGAPKKALTAKPGFEKYGESGRRLEIPLELVGGTLVNLKVKVTAGVLNDPTTFGAALILDNTRIRGVDYCAVERRRYFKVAIPKGWHHNLIDPNLPSSDPDSNRHEGLSDFQVDDLHGFVRSISKLWNIDFGYEETLL